MVIRIFVCTEVVPKLWVYGRRGKNFSSGVQRPADTDDRPSTRWSRVQVKIAVTRWMRMTPDRSVWLISSSELLSADRMMVDLQLPRQEAAWIQREPTALTRLAVHFVSCRYNTFHLLQPNQHVNVFHTNITVLEAFKVGVEEIG